VDHAGTKFIDEVARRVERDEPSVIDDADTVAEGLRLLHVVGGIDDRDSFVTIEALDAFEDVIARLRVDAYGGFVQEQHARLVQQADREVRSPHHAA